MERVLNRAPIAMGRVIALLSTEVKSEVKLSVHFVMVRARGCVALVVA
jgi:hypothetical protein